ncbi:MAG TPA: dipeptidase [Syntrophomonadaceae bacterium]|nr:dipeptidase [Syntrophomonadaceae bacterium]
MKIIDLHCDTLSKLVENRASLFCNTLHFDIERALRAGVRVQFLAFFTPPAAAHVGLRQVLLQWERFLLALEEHSSAIYQIMGRKDLDAQENQERLGCLLHLEGGEALGEDTELLHILHHMGLRSLGLTWNPANLLAGGVDAEGEQARLTGKGREMLREMDRLGIILDLSHIAPQAYFEALETYERPVMVTHGNVYQLCPHRRNLNDEQLRALADHGGVIGLNQVNDFVRQTGGASTADFLDHAAYVADLIGVEYLALGSDFDGADRVVLPGVEAYEALPQLLSERGFTAQEVEMILSKNALRVMNQVI